MRAGLIAGGANAQNGGDAALEELPERLTQRRWERRAQLGSISADTAEQIDRSPELIRVERARRGLQQTSDGDLDGQGAEQVA